MTDATLARIEDHLRRIADALESPRTERLPGLLDIAQRGLDRVAASLQPTGSPDDSRVAMQDLAMELRDALDAKPCDDRTCTDRDHWAPRGPNQCDPGCTRPSLHDGDCDNPCAATMPGHRCTRAEHADDRHVWAMSDEEAQRILRAGQDLGFVAEADPLDESDHRARHCMGDHVYRWGHEHWHAKDPSARPDWCACAHPGDRVSLSDWVRAGYGPLTFCDCEPEPEPDPLDEDDHRPRHNRYGGHVYRHGPEHWHDYGLEDGRCDMEPAMDDPVRLADFPGPLTFCDCDAANVEAENGATD